MNHARVIDRLGGPTKVHRLYAPHRHVPVTTIHGWVRRDRIPQRHWYDLIMLGMKAGIRISLSDFHAIFRTGGWSSTFHLPREPARGPSRKI